MKAKYVVLPSIFLAVGLLLVVAFMQLSKRLPAAPAPSGNGPGASSTPQQPTSSAPQANITVTAPAPGDTVGLPLVIKGQARVFENQFNWRLRDGDGTVLVEGRAMSDAQDAGLFGNYTITANYPLPASDHGTVEVFDYSAKDGSEIDMVSVPVRFDRNAPSTTVSVYFNNPVIGNDPNMVHCETTYPVRRRIAPTTAVAGAALRELLAGPLPAETAKGYSTAIPAGTIARSVSITGDIARVDFNAAIEGGGSCRVASITSAVTNTLKQFATVRSVVISVEGKTEDVLQP